MQVRTGCGSGIAAYPLLVGAVKNSPRCHQSVQNPVVSLRDRHSCAVHWRKRHERCLPWVYSSSLRALRPGGALPFPAPLYARRSMPGYVLDLHAGWLSSILHAQSVYWSYHCPGLPRSRLVWLPQSLPAGTHRIVFSVGVLLAGALFLAVPPVFPLLVFDWLEAQSETTALPGDLAWQHWAR